MSLRLKRINIWSVDHDEFLFHRHEAEPAPRPILVTPGFLCTIGGRSDSDRLRCQVPGRLNVVLILPHKPRDTLHDLSGGFNVVLTFLH